MIPTRCKGSDCRGAVRRARRRLRARQRRTRPLRKSMEMGSQSRSHTSGRPVEVGTESDPNNMCGRTRPHGGLLTFIKVRLVGLRDGLTYSCPPLGPGFRSKSIPWSPESAVGTGPLNGGPTSDWSLPPSEAGITTTDDHECGRCGSLWYRSGIGIQQPRRW